MRKFLVVLAIVIIGLTLFVWSRSQPPSSSNPPQDTSKTSPSTPSSTTPDMPKTTIIAENLDTPWGMVFLPDGSMLVTERPGRVRLVDNDGNLQNEPVIELIDVEEIGEGGLLGIALHPAFSNNHFVYLYYTYGGDDSGTQNRVVRMTYINKRLVNEKTITDQIPGSANHNGGRIHFGPDGYLYITTGDAGDPPQAQSTDTLGGKILRTTVDGSPAPDNPFNNLVYSYGHRNPQGLAWDSKGQLWATEHGRSGVLSGLDELNHIEKGTNYGWPTIQGDGAQPGMQVPKLHSGPSKTWAPAGAAFLGNSIFFGGLRGRTLYEAVIDGENISLKEHFAGEFGRIREVVAGPNGMLYMSTSNRDGRGSPSETDDRIIRVNPAKL